MFEAILLVKPPNCWMREVMDRLHASMKIQSLKGLTGEDGIEELFEIMAEPEISKWSLGSLSPS